MVDTRIAHFDAIVDDANLHSATYGDLDNAIDNVAELTRKYTLLFTAASIAEMEPAISGDWKQPFRSALF